MNQKPRLLVVDDEEAVRLSAKYSFDKWFDITMVETMAKALSLLEKERFDIVLLDIVIKTEEPDAGVEALKIINKKYPNLPVVMLSGSLSWMQKWDMLRGFGAFGYLSKPFEQNKSRAIIERCLKGERIEKIFE